MLSLRPSAAPSNATGILQLLGGESTSSSFSTFRLGLLLSGALALLLVLCYVYRLSVASKRRGQETAFDRWNRQYSGSGPGAAQRTALYDESDSVTSFQSNPLASAAHGGGRNKFATRSLDPLANTALAATPSELSSGAVLQSTTNPIYADVRSLNPLRQNPLRAPRSDNVLHKVRHVDEDCEL